jgi:hypothetical protein
MARPRNSSQQELKLRLDDQASWGRRLFRIVRHRLSRSGKHNQQMDRNDGQVLVGRARAVLEGQEVEANARTGSEPTGGAQPQSTESMPAEQGPDAALGLLL